jgi:hypothetical protein
MPDDLNRDFEDWFIEHGVPQFGERYNPRERLRFLVVPFAGLVAFQIGPAPWLGRTTVLQLAVVPPLFLGFALWARRLVSLLERGRGRGRRWWQVFFWLAALAVAVYLLHRSSLGPLGSGAWVDFAAGIVTLGAAVLLSSQYIWRCRTPRLARRRLQLVVLACVTIAVFAVEGTLVDPFSATLSAHLPWPKVVPPAFPELVAAAALLVLSAAVFRATRDVDLAAPLDPAAIACYPAVPLLMIVFFVEATVLPRATGGVVQAVLPVAACAVLFAYSALTRSRRLSGQLPAGLNEWERLKRAASRRSLLTVFLLLYLVGYPAVVWRFVTVQAAGRDFDGWQAAAIVLCINLLYLLVASSVVGFGLDRIAKWVFREAWQKRGEVVQGLARGVPLLLAFNAFFALTAETWQVATRTAALPFFALVMLLAALSAAFLWVMARQELENQSGFRSWRVLRWAALRKDRPGGKGSSGDRFRVVLNARPPADEDLSPQLSGRGRANALLVVMVYQAFVFTPLVGLSAALFWLIGRLAVPAPVAAEWIYGDNAGAAATARLEAMSFWAEPWTRVPLILAMFSLLYIAVTVLTNDEQREQFFAGASDALRQRLALRVAYRLRPDQYEQDAAAAAS